MRVEYLSDSAGKQLRAAERRLEKSTKESAALGSAHRQALGDLRAARRAKPWWKRVFAISVAEELAALRRTEETGLQQAQASYAAGQAYHSVQQKAAGAWGEDALAYGLSSLPDSWVLLRGYRNRRGEADVVLVGPLGVWAVEVKRRPVRIHAAGDEWWYEKLDRWGNVVETGRATDGGGRSWARQVNDVAEDLSGWLKRNGQRVPIQTAVMLMHERAEIGQCEKLTVTLVATHPQHLLTEIGARAARLSADTCGRIVDLIRRDHQFHEQRRRRRS